MTDTEVEHREWEKRQKWLGMALVRSSDWFKIHSDQRIKMFNFFIVILLALVAASTAAIKDGSLYYQILVGCIMVIVAFCFKALDDRTSLLIKDSEAALGSIDANISEVLGNEFSMVVSAESKRGTFSYRQVFTSMYILAIIFGIGLILFALDAIGLS